MATNFWELLQQHQGDLTKSGRTVAVLITGEVSAHFSHACSSFWHLQYLYYGKSRLWCEGISEKEKWQ